MPQKFGATHAIKQSQFSHLKAHKLQSRLKKLKPFLESTYDRFHNPKFLSTDPILNVHQFSDPRDREIAAFFSAFLAYGNVKQINKSVSKLLHLMKNAPYDFIFNLNIQNEKKRFSDFKHRFTDAEDILCTCYLLHQVYNSNADLQSFFQIGYNPEDSYLDRAASIFLERLFNLKFTPYFDRDFMLKKSSFKHFLPDPARGSACKRLWLFLRWMCRPDDGVDLGVWDKMPYSKLLMPLDTHVFRIGTNLGLITRKSPDLVASKEMTKNLSIVSQNDPTRYDFSLCRVGILKECPTVLDKTHCKSCGFYSICETRKKLL